ncbi:unnamed protein product [marine sediment metagenome]|uniref:Uncharacterized protein n=1 Tax=marine sediment metagenome TaxID=412755 RepID=X1T5Z9_9ZZZZ
MARKLRDLEIDEISLVNKAATRKKFMVIKSAEVIALKKIADLIEEFSDGVFDETLGREDFEKKDVPQEVKDELKEALEALNKYKDDFPDDLKSAVDFLLKFVAVSYEPPGKEGPGKKKVKKQQAYQLISIGLLLVIVAMALTLGRK